MSIRLVVTSQKGGVGKTTVALNLALAMAERGWNTLLVDLDPQGGVGHSLARGDTALPGVADLLVGACTPAEAVMHTRQPGLAILPRGRLNPVEALDYEQALQHPATLRALLDRVEHGTRITIMDTPAGVGMVTRGALRVADFALVPFQAEPLAVRSMTQVMQVLDHVRQNENASLRLLGAVPTMVDRDHATGQQVLMDIWRDFPGVLETTIPRAEVFAAASLKGLPVGYLGGAPPEARRFALLAEEVDSLITRSMPEQEKSHGDAPDRPFL